MAATLRARAAAKPADIPTNAASTTAKNPLIHNPTTKDFEFLGPHGTIFTVLGLPFATLLLNILCTSDGFPSPSLYASPQTYLQTLYETTKFWDPTAMLAVLGWLAFQSVLYVALPGPMAPGAELRTGGRLYYRINAFRSLVVSLAVGVAAMWVLGPAPAVWVAANLVPLATAATIYATVQSVALYVASFRDAGRVLLAEGGNSGYPVYDFWMGRELNPRVWGGFDLKYFCELRPGLIGWVVIDVCLAVAQWQALGGRITNSMALVLVFQAYYVVDALWNEPAILTTMDITTDGFGFMLTFGDLAWVPFTYSLQSVYLTHYPVDLAPSAVAAIVAIKLLGLFIFRSANSQKNAFRTNPESAGVKGLQYIPTKTGSRLLVSGWWGIARHINYFGDWLMGLAWCLPCGFAHPLPYFYAIYFGILLVHRAARDDHKCKAKYGADWAEYCRRVPSKFIPYIW
ncbi:ergosterol biosynthesis ERG4/ERG24 [Blyttiomyces helicus]|uniref:Delta(14)-sterol reductase ERG24 n=1 Tax=Blyttiomyces helicus TaxID=388810 RepID=A0A4P9WGK3_9FUNG|nr:ergosterol biosynthesis ERG4/ERG24 [Blyttiomyces helicus]|eukprot:RKO91949.1 ergosterol biosynthesis ERG4/ERG24 [Blyttiomyces helicus]